MEIYEELVRKYRSELIRFCMGYMNRDISSAEDVVQEVFLTLYRKKGINFDDNIRAWLYETAKILMKKYMRENPVCEDLDVIEELSDESQKFYKESIFDILTEDEKELAVAYYMGADSKQLAKKYNTSVNAIYCKIRRIRCKIKNDLNKNDKIYNE